MTTKTRLLQALWICLLAGAAQAQSITVKVPFSFAVGNKTLPAGKYLLVAEKDRMTVQDAEGKSVYIGLSQVVGGHRADINGDAIFHCYETRCFLAELWSPDRDNGSRLSPSRAEVELAKHQRGTAFAVLSQTPHSRE